MIHPDAPLSTLSKNVLRLAAVSSLGFVLASCGDTQPTPQPPDSKAPETPAETATPMSTEDFLAAKQQELVDRHVRAPGVRRVGSFTSKQTGIKVRIYSDDALHINRRAMEAAIFSPLELSDQEIAKTNAGTTNEDVFTRLTSAYVDAIKKASDSGVYEGKTMNFLVSSDTDSCLQTSDTDRETETDSSEESLKYSFSKPDRANILDSPDCSDIAVTPTVAASDPSSGEVYATHDNTLSIVSTGTYKGRTTTRPMGKKFTLTTEQNTAANIRHESVHQLLRLANVPRQIQAEEQSVQIIEAHGIQQMLHSDSGRYPVSY